MLASYVPILVLFGVAFALALVLMTLSRIAGPYRPNKIKLDPYESGMDPVGQAKERYSIAFYLVAMEFIVFDLEVIFIYPWAVGFRDLGVGTFYAMVVLVVILFVGLFYTLRKGTLDWDMKSLKHQAMKL